MGKSLAELFFVHRSSAKRLSKLKTLLGLAIARLALLKNQHQARCSLAHSDIAQFLHLGHCDRALLRAEIVVKEENMLDVFAMIQSYCHLITERSLLLQRQKDCPHELKEAISSLIYASSRSGEMPELQHVCILFSDMFSREFVSAATELRNSCGVNPKIVQKLSTRQPSLESRVKIIREIAAEEGITLDLGYEGSEIENVDPDAVKIKKKCRAAVDSGRDFSSGRSTHSYKDVASAAQAAYEKAEDAAAAAKATMELSRSSQSSDDHDNRKDDGYRKKIDGLKEDDEKLERVKVYPVQYYCPASDEEEEEAVLYSDKHRETSGDNELRQGHEQLQSGFCSDSTIETLKEKKLTILGSWASKKNNETNALFENKNESESENDGISEKQRDNYIIPIHLKKYPARKFTGECFKNSVKPDSNTTGLLDSTAGGSLAISYYSETISPQTETVSIDYTKKSPVQHSKVTRRAFSVRTRRGMLK